MALVNAEVYPWIPAKGSVRCLRRSAPLAQYVAAAAGEGKARWQGERLPRKRRKSRVKPDHPGGERGLALLNGTQGIDRFALRGLSEAEDRLPPAVVCGALTTEAVLASRRPSRCPHPRGARSARAD